MKRKSSLINRKPLRSKEDGSWRRMVRFRGLDKDTVPESSSGPSIKTQVPRLNSPKTAEYAFFRKLKEGLCHTVSPCRAHECKGQPDRASSSDYSRDGTNGLENSCKDFPSSLNFKDAIPHDLVSLFSPHNYVSKKLGGRGSSEHSCNIGLSMDSSKNNEGVRLTAASSLQNTEDSGADMFSVKRQRLCMQVLNASFSNMDELRSERHDLVSMLLTRLFPQMHEDRDWKILNTKEVSSDTKFSSTVVNHSELYKVPMLDVAFSSSWLDIPRQTELSNYDPLISSSQYKVPVLDMAFASSWLDLPRQIKVSDYDPLISSSHMRYGDYRIQELGSAYEITPKIEHDVCLHHNNNCSSLEYQLNYAEDPKHPSEFFSRGESQPLLLGWDIDNMTEERNLPSTKELAVFSTSYGPLHSEQWRLDYTSTASGLRMSPLLSHQLTNIPLQQCTPSANHISMLEADDRSSFLLPSSEMTNCLTLDKYSNCGTNAEGDDVFLTPENHLWWISKYRNEDHHHFITRGHLPFGVDIDIQKFLIKNIFMRHQYESSSQVRELSWKEIYPRYDTVDEYEDLGMDPGLGGLLLNQSAECVNIKDRHLGIFYKASSINEEKAWLC